MLFSSSLRMARHRHSSCSNCRRPHRVTDETIEENGCIMTLRTISISEKEAIDMGPIIIFLCSTIIIHSQ